MSKQPRPRVVIVGAGFAGVEAARTLASAQVEVTLIDRHNYHTFSPLLHQVATGELSPEQVAWPLRTEFRRWPNVQFRMAEVKGINHERKHLDIGQSSIPYDFLILSLGSTARLENVPGGVAHAFPLKSLPQALRLRSHILRCFEQAAYERNPWRQQQLLTFVVVGGGDTGVEVAGALSELFQVIVSGSYPTVPLSSVRIVLVHSRDRLLSHLPKSLSRYALAQLAKRGIEVQFQTRVTEVTPQAVLLEGKTPISTHTVIWAAGVQGGISKDLLKIPLTRQRRISVFPDLTVPNHPSISVVGDLAELSQSGRVLPMVAPVAASQGRTAAKNILRQLRGQQGLPYSYHHRGSMAILGRHAAVAQIGRLSITGFPAWVLWLGVHLAVLRGMRNKVLTVLNWFWTYYRRNPAGLTILSEPLSSIDQPIEHTKTSVEVIYASVPR